MQSLVKVPQGATLLDVLAERYRAAFDQVKGGRAQWIEGTLDLAAVLLEAKRQPELLDNKAFSRWIERHGLKQVSKDNRAALLGFAKNLDATRKELEQTESLSWDLIWRKMSQRTVRRTPNSQPRPVSRRTLREQRIPSVMRDDVPLPPASPVSPRKRLSDYALTPEQVDPDFKGTHLEFKTKYGHVNLQTREQIEHHKQQEALSAWLGTMADLDRAGQAMRRALASVDPATLRTWISKPVKAEKLRVWRKSIQLASDELMAIG